MIPDWRHRMTLALLLGATLLGVLFYLSGLTGSLRLGDPSVRGFLLVPALPTSLYITMALVVLAGVGVTLLASILQRRRKQPPPQQPREEARRSPWQAFVTLIVWLVLMCLGVILLIRHSPQLLQLWDRLRAEIEAVQSLLEVGRDSLVYQVSSPTAGYALFAIVIVVYGGLALLGLWVLMEGRGGAHVGHSPEDPHARQVWRAMTAGVRALQEHTDPRQAIIACYARLERLLGDHGVPAYRHLTPQEYMGAALRGLDLPQDAFAGLVELFELARYSLHPLDDAARTTALIHLTKLTTHLESEMVHVPRA